MRDSNKKLYTNADRFNNIITEAKLANKVDLQIMSPEEYMIKRIEIEDKRGGWWFASSLREKLKFYDIPNDCLVKQNIHWKK